VADLAEIIQIVV